jgi:cytochrome c556
MGAMVATALATAGMAGLAPRDDTPLGKLMEKVQDHNAKILKGVRTAPNYKKSQEDVASSAKELIQLGKDSKPFTDPAKKEKQPQEKWDKLCDEFVKEAEKFSETVAKKETTQVEAKNAYKAVQKSCTDCHDVFRKEEE